MAIKRYTQAESATVTSFVSFLNENKAGTFLENMTIGGDSSEQLSVSDGKSTFQITFVSTGATNNKSSFICKYGSVTWSGATYNSGYLKFNEAVLCDNGLLLRCHHKYSSSSDENYAYFGLTADQDGDLAVIYPENTSGVGTTTRVVAYDSTVASTYTSQPQFGATLSSLAPMVPVSADNTATLPYAYSAISSQVSERGIYIFDIDGTAFISNGVWYIKDGA